MDLEEIFGQQKLEQRKNVLVFGGNRFVGKALIEKLLDQGYNVDMFNRSGTGIFLGPKSSDRTKIPRSFSKL